MEEIIFDRHARHRMKWRKITENEVRLVLENPDKTEPTEKEGTNAYKTVGDRILKVVYKKFPDHILVITAMDKS